MREIKREVNPFHRKADLCVSVVCQDSQVEKSSLTHTHTHNLFNHQNK